MKHSKTFNVTFVHPQSLNQALLGYNITAMLHTSITLETISLWLFQVLVFCIKGVPTSKDKTQTITVGHIREQNLARLTLEGTAALNGVCTAPGLPSFQDINRPQQCREGNEQTKNQLKPTTLFPGNDIIVVLCVSPSYREYLRGRTNTTWLFQKKKMRILKPHCLWMSPEAASKRTHSNFRKEEWGFFTN